MKTILLGSAPDLNSIQSLIARFWYTNDQYITLKYEGDKLYTVYQNGQAMEGFRVIEFKKRFRFEGIQ